MLKSFGIARLTSGLVLACGAAACTLATWGINDGESGSGAAANPASSGVTSGGNPQSIAEKARTLGLSFGFDTTRPSVDGTVHDVPGIALQGRLSSAKGKRALEIVRDGKTLLLAESGWYLPPVAASASNQVAICWTEIDGGANSDAPPEPGARVAVVCRVLSGDAIGERMVIAGADAPAWLADLTATANGVDVRYYRNADGLLFGDRAAEDGLYSVTLRDGRPGPAERVSEASP